MLRIRPIRVPFSAPASALFRSSRGSHTARAVRAVRAANGDAVALAIDPVLAAKLNEVAR